MSSKLRPIGRCLSQLLARAFLLDKEDMDETRAPTPHQPERFKASSPTQGFSDIGGIRDKNDRGRSGLLSLFREDSKYL
ncbi:MAG: hypothetical protein PHU73_03060 [Patescibacteria group bacterium]|nr:hypothetical protein [Patescibacteria group bacterium]